MSFRTIRVLCTLALFGAFLVPLAGATPPQEAANEHMQAGLELIQNGQPEKALEEFEKAIEADPELAAAHYYAGMALGQLQRFEESMERFLETAELDPGNGQAHVMACRTAYTLQDYEESWNQAILAAQAGVDMADAFAGLEQVSSRPADFDARMSTPRVFVAEIDLSRATTGDADPTNTTGASRTIASQLEYFVQIQRQFGLSLGRSEQFSVTKSLEQATYVLLVEIDNLEELTGLLKLIDAKTDETVISRPVTFPPSIGSLRATTDRLVGFLGTSLG